MYAKRSHRSLAVYRDIGPKRTSPTPIRSAGAGVGIEPNGCWTAPHPAFSASRSLDRPLLVCPSRAMRRSPRLSLHPYICNSQRFRPLFQRRARQIQARRIRSEMRRSKVRPSQSVVESALSSAGFRFSGPWHRVPISGVGNSALASSNQWVRGLR